MCLIPGVEVVFPAKVSEVLSPVFSFGVRGLGWVESVATAICCCRGDVQSEQLRNAGRV
jgi:hypothetical protein